MEELAKLLSALASLAWPAVVAVLLVKLHGPLRKLIESASARKFTLKVAGNELSMEEASEQQGKMVRDLQLKLAELEQRLAGGAAPQAGPAAQMAPAAAASPRTPQAAPIRPPAQGRRLLWVDDKPRNNSYLVAALEEQGVRVDTAASTDEGLAKFKAQPYDIVVSDMERGEGAQAGIDLTRRLKAMAPQLPVYIYCGPGAARNLRAEALAAGAAGITASGTELLSALPLDLRR